MGFAKRLSKRRKMAPPSSSPLLPAGMQQCSVELDPLPPRQNFVGSNMLRGMTSAAKPTEEKRSPPPPPSTFSPKPTSPPPKSPSWNSVSYHSNSEVSTVITALLMNPFYKLLIVFNVFRFEKKIVIKVVPAPSLKNISRR